MNNFIKIAPIKPIAILLLLLEITSGCSLIYPVYHRPTINIPNDWSIGSIPLQLENNLPYTAWWAVFKDPILNHLIECGLQTNNTVGIARGNIEKAQGELRSVQLSWIPSPSFLGGLSQNPNLGAPGLFYSVFPGYFAFNLFNTLAREKSAKINVEAKHYLLDATNLVLIGQITSSYYTYIAQVEQLRLLVRYIKDTQELLDILGSEYKVGLSSLIVLQETEQFLATLKSEQHLTENNLIKSQNALRYLLNQNPGTVPEGIQFNKVDTVYPSFGSLPAAVLNNRPDVALAEAQYRIAVQNIGIANTQLLPLIQLDRFYGYIQFSPQAEPVNGVGRFTDAYTKWIVDPSIFGEIRALTGAKKVAYYAYIDTIRLALRDVANDLSTHQKANERYQDIKRAYEAAKEKTALNNDLYKQGIIAYRDWLYNQLTVDQAALQLNNIKLIQMLAIVSLYQNLGGGYKAYLCAGAGNAKTHVESKIG